MNIKRDIECLIQSLVRQGKTNLVENMLRSLYDKHEISFNLYQYYLNEYPKIVDTVRSKKWY